MRYWKEEPIDGANGEVLLRWKPQDDAIYVVAPVEGVLIPGTEEETVARNSMSLPRDRWRLRCRCGIWRWQPHVAHREGFWMVRREP